MEGKNTKMERLIEQSELVAGLVWQGRVSANKVHPRMFVPPLNEIMNDFLSGKPPEEIISIHGNAPIQNAIYRAQGVNGLGEDVDQVMVLETLNAKYRASQRLEKLSRKLEEGKEIDWSELTDIAAMGQVDSVDYFHALNTIEARITPFIKCGFTPWDRLIGGIPETGLIIVAGDPGSAKTTLCIEILKDFIRLYPKKVGVLNSLEMLLEDAAMRAHEVDPKLTEDESCRFLISEHQSDPVEIINKAATVQNLGLLVVDFADLMIRGETTESATAHIYRTLAQGAKSLRIPIILIAQLNRTKRDIPRPYHIRYSSMAEIVSSLIVMLHNPTHGFRETWDNIDKNNPLHKQIPGLGWHLVWKCRGGFRVEHEGIPEEQRGPFAMGLRYLGSKGWLRKTHPKYIIPLNSL